MGVSSAAKLSAPPATSLLNEWLDLAEMLLHKVRHCSVRDMGAPYLSDEFRQKTCPAGEVTF
jgi:hypothetical protein